jgi:acetyltransferase-like isoleucine patch superfamily enzyme
VLGRVRRRLLAWQERPYLRHRFWGRLREPYWRHRFAAFGSGSVLVRPRLIQGARKISIGKDCFVYHDAWLSAEPDTWARDRPAIVIGDRVQIRTDVTISAADSIVIEDDVVMAGGVTIIDSDHTHDGPAAAVAFNPLVTAPIRIGRGTWIAERAVILRGSDIGSRCIIGAGSIVRGEIPDGSIAVGAPARVVGRTGPIQTDLVDHG